MATSQQMLSSAKSHPETRGGKKWILPHSLQREHLVRGHTDFGLLTSRTVREYVPKILCHQVCDICYNSSRKQTHLLCRYFLLVLSISFLISHKTSNRVLTPETGRKQVKFPSTYVSGYPGIFSHILHRPSPRGSW